METLRMGSIEPGIEQPIINMTGEKVALGPMRRDQLHLYLRWFNDFEYGRTTSSVRPMSAEALTAYYDHDIKDPSQVHFTIYDRTTLTPIGGVNLTEIRGQTATFAIGIGEKAYRGRGNGTEATRLVLEYGFKGLGLHNIWLSVFAFNEQGIAAYKRAGFKEVGRRREVLNRFGKLHDLIYMDCLASEFKGAMISSLQNED
jgi:RimJ/RimL family protein N-acetyltransferase